MGEKFGNSRLSRALENAEREAASLRPRATECGLDRMSEREEESQSFAALPITSPPKKLEGPSRGRVPSSAGRKSSMLAAEEKLPEPKDLFRQNEEMKDIIEHFLDGRGGGETLVPEDGRGHEKLADFLDGVVEPVPESQSSEEEPEPEEGAADLPTGVYV